MDGSASSGLGGLDVTDMNVDAGVHVAGVDVMEAGVEVVNDAGVIGIAIGKREHVHFRTFSKRRQDLSSF